MTARRKSGQRLRPVDFYSSPLTREEKREASRGSVAAMVAHGVECYRITGNGWWAWRAIGLWAGLGPLYDVPLPPELAKYLVDASILIASEKSTSKSALKALRLLNQRGGRQFASQAEAEREQFDVLWSINARRASGMSAAQARKAVAQAFGRTEGAIRQLETKWRRRAAQRL